MLGMQLKCSYQKQGSYLKKCVHCLLLSEAAVCLTQHVHTCRITDGTFGHAEYFQDLVDNVNDMTKSNDWFLLANDFAGYMKAQDEVDKVRCSVWSHQAVRQAQCTCIISLFCNLFTDSSLVGRMCA